MRKDEAPIYRLSLSVLLGGVCLSVLWMATARGTRAAPVDLGEVGQSLDPGPIAANGAYTMYLPLTFREHGSLANGDFEDGLRAWTAGRGPFAVIVNCVQTRYNLKSKSILCVGAQALVREP